MLDTFTVWSLLWVFMPGPPPKDPAMRRRRNATPGFKLLPHQGRSGRVPSWPLPAHPDEEVAGRELSKWRELWRLPQAVEWERMRDFGTVAMYVRVFVRAASLRRVALVTSKTRDGSHVKTLS